MLVQIGLSASEPAPYLLSPLQLPTNKINRPQDGDLFGRESFEANIHWTVHAIGDLYDTDFPHSTCYIVDEAPLRNGVLSTSELLTLMSLFGTRLLAEEYHRHRIIPVCRAPLLSALNQLLSRMFRLRTDLFALLR